MSDIHDFIAKHLVEELVSDIDPPVRVYLYDWAHWADEPLSPAEWRAGWAHAETTGEVAVLRFCPAVMADHLAGRELGARTTSLRPDGTADPIGDTALVDTQLRMLELFLKLEIVNWEPGLDQAVVSRRAYLELCTASSTLAARLRETFTIFHTTLQEATSR